MSDNIFSGEDADKSAGGNNYSNRLSMGWLLPLLLIVLSAGLILYFMKGSSSGTVGVLPVDDTITNSKIILAPDSIARIAIGLADGGEITGLKNGIEDQLIAYIISKDPADSISKNRWFDFNELNFKTNSADITDESMAQLKNIAAILNANPAVKIKIGGYTDKTGNEATNLDLSAKRANAVAETLKVLITNPRQVVGDEGYGSQFAKAAATAPDEERKKDRRISLNVKAK